MIRCGFLQFLLRHSKQGILLRYHFVLFSGIALTLVRNNFGILSMRVFSLLYFYYMTSVKSAFCGPKYKIILVGDSGVGKTSIFWQYIHNEVSLDHPMTTIDFRYKMIKLHEKLVKLCIWDTAGQEKFRSIVATYFKSCQGVILVFDLASRESW